MPKIPNHFIIINQSNEFIEFRSKYHYWRAVQSRYDSNLYYLHHKHKLEYPYHIQAKTPMTLMTVYKVVLKHDSYCDGLTC